MTGIIITGILAILTELYLMYSSYMDLKERMIYSVPAEALSILWIILVLGMKVMPSGPLIFYLLIQFALQVFLRKFSIWGDGDNDVLLLLGMLLPVFMGDRSIYHLLFIETLLTAVSVFIAVVISVAEYCLKGRSWSISADAAVVPGFTAVIISLFIWGFTRGNVR